MGDGAVSVSRLTAQLPGGSDLRAVGTIGPVEDNPARADIAVELASGDLRRLLDWAGIDVDAIPSSRLRAFNGRAGITGTLDDLQIAGMDMTVDATHITGGLAYRGQGRPGLGLRLVVDDLNLDAYSTATVGTPRQALAQIIRVFSDGWPVLAGFDANIDVELGRLTVAETSLDGIRLDGTLNHGSLDLREFTIANLDGGSASLQGRVDQIWPLDGFDITLNAAVDAPQALLDRFSIDPGWPIERLGAAQGQVRMVGGFERVDLEVQLDVSQGDIALGGSVADPLGRPVYDLAARITHEDLLQAIHLIWPNYTPREVLGALDLYATVEGTGDTLMFDDMIGQFGDITVGGSINLDMAGGSPVFDAAIGINDVAIEPFLPTPETSFVAPGATLWSSVPFEWPDLSGFEGHLLLTANAIQGAGLHLDTPALDATLSNGTLNLTQASAGLFGGQLGVTGHLSMAEPTELSVDIAFANADLTTLLSDVLGSDGTSGTLDLALSVSGVGDSPADLIAGLQGDGLLAARDGTVDRLDLTAVSDRLGALDGPLEFLEVVRGPLIEGTTAFSAFNAPLTVEDGILSSDAVRWRADAGLGEGTASLNLASMVFDAMLEISLFAFPDAPPFNVGFSGPLDRLERLLETDALSAWVAQRAAEALTDRLRTPAEPSDDGAADGSVAPEPGLLVPDAGGPPRLDEGQLRQETPDPTGGLEPAAIDDREDT